MAGRESIQDVNIAAGDDMSNLFYEAAKLTYANRPGYVYQGHESFSGFRAIDGDIFGRNIGRLAFGQGFDGIGTKVEVAERLNEHSGSAFDLFAMTLDDAPVRGAEVISIGTILDVSHLDDQNEIITNGMRQLAQGMVRAAKVGRVVVINGEIAELGGRIKGYGDFNYNWGAGVWWAANKQRILDGNQIKPGDSLVGFAEPGFRSNGITDVRKAMLENYGREWHNQVEKSLGEVSLGKLIQTPSTIYSAFVNELTGGFDIDKEPKAEVHAVAHITGGGQPSKLGRMLENTGLGVTIDKPIDPPEMMLHVQSLRGFSDTQAYGKWHMGPGMVVVTPDPERVLAEAETYNQTVPETQRIHAKNIGEVTEEQVIRIKNRGVTQYQEWLDFPVAA